MWVAVAEGRAWVWWQADSDVTPEVVARRIMPLEGAELFTRTDGQWYRLGERLPAFGVPMGALAAGLSLDRIVVPAKITAQRPAGNLPERLTLRVVPCDSPRNHPASATQFRLMSSPPGRTGRPLSQLSSLRGAWRGGVFRSGRHGGGSRVGRTGNFAALPGSTRFWGADLLVPLGFRVIPNSRVRHSPCCRSRPG